MSRSYASSTGWTTSELSLETYHAIAGSRRHEVLDPGPASPRRWSSRSRPATPCAAGLQLEVLGERRLLRMGPDEPSRIKPSRSRVSSTTSAASPRGVQDDR